MKLYHFTCDHGHDAIGSRGELRPQIPHVFLRCKVIWLTTEGAPDREATGLGQHLVKCDRMAYRYVVTDLTKCRRWLDSPEREMAPPQAVIDLESYGDPEHWWITSEPVSARLA